jgi:hypothetical protein
MSEADKLVNQIARQLYAMSMKKKDKDIPNSLRNERYQRTMTDEYPFAKKPRGHFSRVEPDQKECWRKLHDK